MMAPTKTHARTPTALQAWTRREMLATLPAAAFLPGVLAQTPASKPSIRVRALNHMTLTVSDVQRSLDFYQGLFGMPIQARQGQTPCLRIGRGPQFIALAKAGANVAPHINHYCFTVEDFNVDRLLNVLAAHGVTRAEAGGAPGGGLSGGPMKVRVRMRGPESGGAKEGTPELYVGDPGGVVVQLQDPTYCGGAGVMGEVCLATPEPSPKKGLLTTGDLSHFTMRTPEPEKTIRFYREAFGMPIQVYQGKVPALGVAKGPQFVMFNGVPGGGGANTPAAATPAGSIHHACLTVDGFHVDRIFKTLNDYGLKPRGDAQGAAPALTYYVSMRMPDRGGIAPNGTPELYFTDPDGLVIQLQDPKYCGGGGALGEICPS